MLATTAAMDGLDTLPAPGWFTSAPKTIVGACFRFRFRSCVPLQKRCEEGGAGQREREEEGEGKAGGMETGREKERKGKEETRSRNGPTKHEKLLNVKENKSSYRKPKQNGKTKHDLNERTSK